jgi:Fe-S-cluster-containing hydrogenase component 2
VLKDLITGGFSMKVLRKIIEIEQELCDGCGQCVPDCAEGALEIVDGKARMIAEKYCDGLGACLGTCPVGALQIVEREADDFDETAVEELLRQSKQEEIKIVAAQSSGGCPSAQFFSFQAASSCQTANKPVRGLQNVTAASGLSHWPVQIRLVPPNAPFLKNSDLLVAADCTPIAYPGFHDDFLKERTIMMGCPKFDDAQGYVKKFVEVFKTADLKSVTILIMEVPCCSAMNTIIREALKQSNHQIPVEQVTISVKGTVKDRKSW